jgi:hypothetical protein
MSDKCCCSGIAVHAVIIHSSQIRVAVRKNLIPQGIGNGVGDVVADPSQQIGPPVFLLQYELRGSDLNYEPPGCSVAHGGSGAFKPQRRGGAVHTLELDAGPGLGPHGVMAGFVGREPRGPAEGELG